MLLDRIVNKKSFVKVIIEIATKKSPNGHKLNIPFEQSLQALCITL
jgi:hypothetical protein